jgi:hypothetical protein
MFSAHWGGFTIKWLSRPAISLDPFLVAMARPRILGALLDGIVHGLRTSNTVQPQELPRMADFALWARACEPLFWPAGTFARTYAANRRAAIESIIDADPLANKRPTFSEILLRQGQLRALNQEMVSLRHSSLTVASGRTFLRSIGIEITFSREGRIGTRMIRVSTRAENCISSVSVVSAAGGNGSRGDQAMVEG